MVTTNTEALVSWSVYPQCPAKELHRFNKFSVSSHLSHARTIFTCRQDLKLMQNKPSINRNKNLDTRSCVYRGGISLPHSQDLNFSTSTQRTNGLLSHTKFNKRPDMHFSFLLPACVHYEFGFGGVFFLQEMNRLGNFPGESEENLVRHK